MADQLTLLVEAERLGLLPPEKLELLNEARRRGLVDASEAKINLGEPWKPKKRGLAEIRAESKMPNDGSTTWGDAYVSAFGKSFRELGLGLTQNIASGGPNAAIAEWLVDKAGLKPRSLSGLVSGQEESVTANPVSRWADERIAANAEADAQLMNQPGSGWGYGTGVLTQMLVPGVGASAKGLNPGAASGLRSLFLPRTILGNAAQGAAFGNIQPVQEGESRLENTLQGGGFGAGGAILGRGLGGLWRLMSQPFRSNSASGVERRAAEVLRQEAEDVARLDRAAPSQIPGVQRSLAEESLDPGIARLERKLRGTSGGFDAIDRANNSARVQAIRKFAGDDAAIATAEEARRAASEPLRREAMKVEGVDTNRLLGQIRRLEDAFAQRPAIQKGLQEIRGLMTRNIPDQERMKAAIAPLQAYIASDRTNAINRELAKKAIAQIRAGEWPSAKFFNGGGEIRGGKASAENARAALAEARKALSRETEGQNELARLYKVRQTIGDMLSGKYGGDSAAALAGSRELIAVRNQLDRVLAKASPEFGQYMDAFKQGSRPINRMELGQQLIGPKSGSAIVDPVTGEQVLTPAAFSRQARNLDQTAATATGFRKARAADILRPQDVQTIRAVEDDLRRQNFRATAGSGGNSQTDERAELGRRLLAPTLARSIPGYQAAADYLERVGQARLQSKLAEVMQNPAQARALLARVPPQERRVIEAALVRSGGLGAIVGQRVSNE